MNSEAVNAICKLCKKRIAANNLFILEHLRLYFFGARLIHIAKKYGGIRPIIIGTIFHKLISSAVMCNLKEKELPGTFSLCSLAWACQEVLREHSEWIRNLLNETIKTGYWSLWTFPMNSTLSAELHSSSKYRTSSPSSSHGCGSAMDSTHTCSSEVQTQSPQPVGSDKVTPWDPSSSALQSSPSWKKPVHRCSPSPT